MKSSLSKSYASCIDHTVLKPQTSRRDIIRVCREARKYGFWSVCVPPAYVSLAKKLISDSRVRVCTVAGFPLGFSAAETKAYEVRKAVRDGADEIDVVVNVGHVKSNKSKNLKKELKRLRKAAGKKTAKLILETCYLTEREIVGLCRMAKKTGFDYVKTSTGFGPRGATKKDVETMRRTVGPETGVKASGGIRTLNDIKTMLAAGASRIGTSNAAAIMRSLKGRNEA
ncbi:MAG: deoxyribose-phosphate aldolase [Endomicrobiales bacterium]|nr:deoxyribose-phosphate aldolase [Endomicrobiales bacterium]